MFRFMGHILVLFAISNTASADLYVHNDLEKTEQTSITPTSTQSNGTNIPIRTAIASIFPGYSIFIEDEIANYNVSWRGGVNPDDICKNIAHENSLIISIVHDNKAIFVQKKSAANTQ